MTTKQRRLVRGSYQNILDVYERASWESKVDGGTWYPLANGWAKVVGTRLSHYGNAMLDYTDERIVVGAGIISALSPQTNWEQNKKMAWEFSETLEKPNWCTEATYNKALAILKVGADVDAIDNILNGNKTKAFFHNIINPYGENNLPTIDRHAISIYLGKRCTRKEMSRGLDGTANKTISNAYIRASKILECTPQILQAITWVQWRKEIKGGE